MGFRIVGIKLMQYRIWAAIAGVVIVATATFAGAEPVRKPDPGVVQYKADLQAYRKAAAAMTPQQAADGWLILFDRQARVSTAAWTELHGYRGGGADETPASALLAALPPPSAWDALATRIAARPLPPADAEPGKIVRTHALRLVAAALRADRN